MYDLVGSTLMPTQPPAKASPHGAGRVALGPGKSARKASASATARAPTGVAAATVPPGPAAAVVAVAGASATAGNTALPVATAAAMVAVGRPRISSDRSDEGMRAGGSGSCGGNP